AISTSSYGSAIPRPYGRLRMPGSIIWATDMVEDKDTEGGGKGGPSLTTYSYSVSCAVALASRPIGGIGRIWADGNLLRGAGGDLKVGGTMRFYDGHGDQEADPLIASAQAGAPAFRHTAYVVFENLQLAEFGNRIPALTFEILADDGEVTLAQLVEALPEPVVAERVLPALTGFAYEGGSLADMLTTVGTVYPLAADAGGEALRLTDADAAPEDAPLLPAPVAADDGESFGALSGTSRQRESGPADVPDVLRYYDVDRDFQAGLQRADGRARAGRGRGIEFPGSLAAADARALVNAAAERAGWARETIAWRTAELDPALTPGAIVRIPERPGNWRIDGWEWRERGVELELRRLPRGPARRPAADPGTVARPSDLLAAPTVLQAFELPWNGIGSASTPRVYAAASAASGGWKGAALYASHGGALTPLGPSGSRRNIVGTIIAAAPPSTAHLIDRASITVELLADDFALSSTTVEGLAGGANRALVGGEVIQFLHVEALDGRQWRLTGLLRGRGGTEAAAQAGHLSGAPFVLLDGTATLLDAALVGPAQEIVALGLRDGAPVASSIANPGLTLRPLTPVHPRSRILADGSLELSWIRRARGAWGWTDEVETPLGEESETYLAGVGPIDAPPLRWNIAVATLTLPPAMLTILHAEHSGAPLWVRQVGSFALSPPLLLTTIT
ncbi:MAG TPA: phage tail protein, partial [Croceibacterium sp.]|nr:phage tail protein [Croceibacterium sp.]